MVILDKGSKCICIGQVLGCEGGSVTCLLPLKVNQLSLFFFPRLMIPLCSVPQFALYDGSISCPRAGKLINYFAFLCPFS